MARRVLWAARVGSRLCSLCGSHAGCVLFADTEQRASVTVFKPRATCSQYARVEREPVMRAMRAEAEAPVHCTHEAHLARMYVRVCVCGGEARHKVGIRTLPAITGEPVKTPESGLPRSRCAVKR